uniref:Uncharacterized protein n=1 Tax=Lactuca sativa TaxID=4236 RepID=A0A9R1XU80_LACSA|nr:hypothetical protein LSAT_V11C300135290 [Lactuca sativa]
MQIEYEDKWRGWIKGCLSSAMALVLSNGSPTNEFIMEKEGLNIAMKTICEKGVFQRVKIPHTNDLVSYLFYANDAFFVGEWSKNNIRNLARINRCFMYHWD